MSGMDNNLLSCLLTEAADSSTESDGNERTPLLIQQSGPANHYLLHLQHQQAINSSGQLPPAISSQPELSDMQFSLNIQGDGDVPITNSLQSGASVGSNKHCHSDEAERHMLYVAAQKVARRRLLIASAACLVFMIGEIVGGAIANSLAIMTDAAHLLTDLASFLISLLALFLATREPSRRMSFGWYRAEVIGALVSVLLIWVVTAILVYLAVRRVVYGDYEVDGKPMLITAGVGVAFNALMALLLHQGHGHAHGGTQQHHSHNHNQHNHNHHHHHRRHDEHSVVQAGNPIRGQEVDHTTSNSDLSKETNDDQPEPAEVELSDTARIVDIDGPTSRHRNRNHNRHHEHHSHEHEHETEQRPYVPAVGGGFGHNHSHNNMNVRAAFIHVVGDLLQSIGVLIAAFVIYYRPEYKLADPICTFIFSLLVMGTTINILRDTLRVLMEATPQGLDVAAFRKALTTLPGVVQVHSLKVWSLTLGRNVAIAHLAVNSSCSVSQRDALVVMATDLAKNAYQFSDVTLQVEPHIVEMDDCEHCRRFA